jgi:hypothetical protein
MKLLQKLAVGGAVAIMTSSAAVALGATPAVAEVWHCESGTIPQVNKAYGACHAGFGYYRVAAECNSGHWPYTKTVYGEWVWRNTSDGRGRDSVASGDPSACHITKAWVQVS